MIPYTERDGCTDRAASAALSFERVSLIAAAVLVAAALGGFFL